MFDVASRRDAQPPLPSRFPKILGLLVALVLTVSSPYLALAHSGQQIDPSLSISNGEEGSGAGLRLIYHLKSPVKELKLGINTTLSSAAHVRPLDGSYNSGIVRLKRPADEIEIRLLPDKNEVDSVYPLLTRVPGRGYVLYGPAVLPSVAVQKITVSLTDGGTRTINLDEAEAGYIFVGSGLVNGTHFSTVTSEFLNQSFATSVVEDANRLIEYFSTKMGRPPPTNPLIILTVAEHNVENNRGDVTSNGVIFLRYSPSTFTKNGDAASYTLTFLSHELFHLWTNRTSSSSEHWWLHEGAAEYASWLALNDLWPEQASLGLQLTNAANRCVGMLRDSSLMSAPPQMQRSARYTCGPLLHWIVDLDVRSTVGEPNTIFDVWTALWTKEPGSSADDLLKEFLSLIESRSSTSSLPLIRDILFTAGTRRWFNLIEELNRLGADVRAQSANDFSKMVAATQALVLSECSEIWGVGQKEGRLFATSEPACRLFANSPVLEKADGLDPSANPSMFLELVTKRCEAGASVRLELSADGTTREFTMRCDTTVQAPPPHFQVESPLPKVS